MALADFEALLNAAMGLHAASIGATTIERAVLERMSCCHLTDPETYRERLQHSAEELQLLIEAVVVPETWFFRDRASFAALGRFACEEWLPSHPVGLMTLLSLPCSTGEEPYSMAMALLDAGIPAHRFRVDGIDISARALAYAARAVYGKNSFRGGDLSFRTRHFSAGSDGYRPSETVRNQVRFRHGNLFAVDLLPGSEQYDVIFCRNVLIYFDRATQDRAILLTKRLLTPTGMLFVAPAETALPPSQGFISTKAPLAFAFRKIPAHHAPVQTPTPPVSVRPRIVVRARSPLVVPRAATAVPPDSARVSPATTPSDIAAVTRLADQGHFVAAAVSCEALLLREGPSAPALYLMGLVRSATGNDLEAIDYYRKTLYLDPEHVDAQIHLASLLEKRGDREGAQVLRNRARRLGLTRVSPHA